MTRDAQGAFPKAWILGPTSVVYALLLISVGATRAPTSHSHLGSKLFELLPFILVTLLVVELIGVIWGSWVLARHRDKLTSANVIALVYGASPFILAGVMSTCCLETMS